MGFSGRRLPESADFTPGPTVGGRVLVHRQVRARCLRFRYAAAGFSHHHGPRFQRLPLTLRTSGFPRAASNTRPCSSVQSCHGIGSEFPHRRIFHGRCNAGRPVAGSGGGGSVSEPPSIASLVRELHRNPALLGVCGFDPLPRQGSPGRWIDEDGVARLVHEPMRYLIPEEAGCGQCRAQDQPEPRHRILHPRQGREDPEQGQPRE